MKQIGIKKIILQSIAILSSIMLIIGLSSKVISLAVLPNVGVLEGIAYETGFSLLDFKSLILDSYNHDITLILISSVAMLCLIVGVIGCILNIFAIFKLDSKKAYKDACLFLVLNMLLSIIILILSIFVVADINKTIKESIGASGVDIDSLLYKTTTFVPVIIQTVFLIGLLLCKKFIPENILKKDKKAEKEELLVEVEKKEELSFAEREKIVIELLKKYKNIYSQNIITVMDFEKRKFSLMFENDNIDLEEEFKKIDVLVNYHQIYGEGIISIDEYEKKKIKILFN